MGAKIPNLLTWNSLVANWMTVVYREVNIERRADVTLTFNCDMPMVTALAVLAVESS